MKTDNQKANLVSAVPTKDLPPAQPKSEATKARCFDPDWKYVKKESTDVAKTFARIRRQQKEAEAAKSAPKLAAATPLKRRA